LLKFSDLVDSQFDLELASTRTIRTAKREWNLSLISGRRESQQTLGSRADSEVPKELAIQRLAQRIPRTTIKNFGHQKRTRSAEIYVQITLVNSEPPEREIRAEHPL
jgi:hypothetical protein